MPVISNHTSLAKTRFLINRKKFSCKDRTHTKESTSNSFAETWVSNQVLLNLRLVSEQSQQHCRSTVAQSVKQSSKVPFWCNSTDVGSNPGIAVLGGGKIEEEKILAAPSSERRVKCEECEKNLTVKIDENFHSELSLTSIFVSTDDRLLERDSRSSRQPADLLPPRLQHAGGQDLHVLGRLRFVDALDRFLRHWRRLRRQRRVGLDAKLDVQLDVRSDDFAVHLWLGRQISGTGSFQNNRCSWCVHENCFKTNGKKESWH